jgi:tetratricopeptide (TPR) repeat protein
LSLPAIQALKQHAERTSKYGDTEKGQKRAEKAAERLFQRYPILEERIPLLLMRGDPAGRQLAYLMATMIETPEVLDALKAFAFSKRGPDQPRMDAARTLTEAGAIPSGPQRLWLQGEWREVMLIGIEIYPEPVHKFSRDVETLLIEGTEALHEGRGADAERYFKAALKKAPESPSILNNLAAAYEAQGKHKLAQEIIPRIRRDFPDYFFGIVTEARILIQEGELKKAQELLNPLLQRRRLHISEMSALCNALIELNVERGEMDNARQWLEIWENVTPDHHRIPYYQFLLS